MKNAPKYCTFGCFKKKLGKKRKIPTNRPKYSGIPLEGNTEMFFFGLMKKNISYLLRQFSSGSSAMVERCYISHNFDKVLFKDRGMGCV